jgi:hypothetical protein
VDFKLPPFAQLKATDVRFFQFWYRDPAGGGALFNTTEALEIGFCH